MGLSAKVYITCLLDIQARFLFFPLHIFCVNNIYYLSSKLSLTYRVNVNHKMFKFLSTLPVWEQEIPWQLSKQTSKLFFQMSAQVYSVPSQTEGEGRPFWNRETQTYPLNYLLHVGVMLTIIKLLIILLLLVRTGNQVQNVQVYSLLGQTEGDMKAFFEGCKKWDQIMRLPPRAFGCHKR